MFFEILALLERKFFSVNIWTEMPEHAQLLLRRTEDNGFSRTEVLP